MVATDSQYVVIPAIFGEHEKAVRGARPELAKAPLSLKLSSPTMPPPAVTVAVDTPSCSPAATPPAGPGQPYGPEVHDEEHLVGAVGSGAMRGPTGSGAMRHYAPASKRHKKDRHIKDLKGGMPPLDINIKLDVIDEAELSEDSPRAGEGYDSDEETASDSSPARRNSDEVDRCVALPKRIIIIHSPPDPRRCSHLSVPRQATQTRVRGSRPRPAGCGPAIARRDGSRASERDGALRTPDKTGAGGTQGLCKRALGRGGIRARHRG